MMLKKGSILLMVLLVSLSGCMGKKNKKAKKPKTKKMAQVGEFSRFNMPLAGDDDGAVMTDENIRSFFDSDSDEFVLVTPDGEEAGEAAYAGAENVADIEGDEFAWVDATGEQDQEYKIINFDFNQYAITPEQKEKIADNVKQAKKEIADNQGVEPTIVLEGHACSSAGSSVYNLALSEKRAKVIADTFAEEGIPVKVVGRGSEVPVIIDGKPLTGDREQQGPNRRAEIHLVYS